MRRWALVVAATWVLAGGIGGTAGFAQSTPPPAAAPAHGGFLEKFRLANTTNDGKLTLQQAQAAGMHMVVTHFAEIDTAHKGYVTLDDIRAARAAHMHAQQGKPPPPPAE